MFAVVEFLEEKAIEIVPESWIETNDGVGCITNQLLVCIAVYLDLCTDTKAGQISN